jgi:hypothetical protein
MTIPGDIQRKALETHRRETQRTILLPAGIGLVALFAVLILVMAVSSRGQVSIVADFLLTLLVLCPLAVCTLPIALLLVVAAVKMNSVHNWTANRLDGLVRVSLDADGRINRMMDNLARNVIKFGVWIAPFEKLVLSAFDPPESGSETEEK